MVCGCIVEQTDTIRHATVDGSGCEDQLGNIPGDGQTSGHQHRQQFVPESFQAAPVGRVDSLLLHVHIVIWNCSFTWCDQVQQGIQVLFLGNLLLNKVSSIMLVSQFCVIHVLWRLYSNSATSSTGQRNRFPAGWRERY